MATDPGSGIGRRQPKVLSVGAAGTYAHLVVPELTRRGAIVRALVHRPETADIARRNGAAEVIVADLNDPAALGAAVRGMDGVFYLGPEFKANEAQLGINMVTAAKRADVEKFVYSSVQHPFLTALANHVGKLPVHEALVESGLNFTILQPTTFMQSIEHFQWAAVLKTGVYSHPIARKAKQSWVDYRDVAEAAALALTEDELGYAVFELAAGGMVTNDELVAMMSQALGREIRVEAPSFDDYILGFQIEDARLLQGYKAICEWYSAHGFPGGNNLSLRTILKRQPRTLQAYLEELAAKSLAR